MELRETKHLTAMRFQGGEKLGDLTLIRVGGTKHFKRGVAVFWLCRCKCGREVHRDRQTLIKSKNSSCGKCRTIGTSPPGKSKHPLYKRWAHMIDRCLNPTNKSFPDYGARGIKVCDRWIKGDGTVTGFECFVSDMGDVPLGMTLERLDSNGDYRPANCVWASRTVQSRNRRTVNGIEFRGETLTRGEWAERTGIPYFTLVRRFKLGWSVERALTEPLNK